MDPPVSKADIPLKRGDCEVVGPTSLAQRGEYKTSLIEGGHYNTSLAKRGTYKTSLIGKAGGSYHNL